MTGTAKLGVYKNGYIKVGNTDLSADCTSLKAETTVPKLPADAFGDSYTYSSPGTPSKTLVATFIKDFASVVQGCLLPLKDGATHVVQWKTDNVAASATNPLHSGLYIIVSSPGLEGGDRGANQEVTVTWEPAADIVESTTP